MRYINNNDDSSYIRYAKNEAPKRVIMSLVPKKQRYHKTTTKIITHGHSYREVDISTNRDNYN